MSKSKDEMIRMIEQLPDDSSVDDIIREFIVLQTMRRATEPKYASTDKKEVMGMVAALPEDITLEEIDYHLYVFQGIKRGLEDLEAGRVIPHEEVKRSLSKWLER